MIKKQRNKVRYILIRTAILGFMLYVMQQVRISFLMACLISLFSVKGLLAQQTQASANYPPQKLIGKKPIDDSLAEEFFYVEYKEMNAKVLAKNILSTAASIGFQEEEEFQIPGKELPLDNFLFYVVVAMTGNEANLQLSAEFDDWIMDDDVTIKITPMVASYKNFVRKGTVTIKRNSKITNRDTYIYNSLVQIQIRIQYSVRGSIGNGAARSQTVEYFYGQNVKVNQKTGMASVSGEPTQLHAAITTTTIQNIKKK
ncbi:hypothetical protein QNI16_10415 [Cytophagaceae bacterium YF14B1]|uniref:Uncharacterized protein n=1 Tax=Xanthocytophaga flava TaxID=3048013 RepID=A0AAE3QPL0_9BACT|nr:hypothetical protein [Xanthocytophaga flavus]MDJ1480895.1 hypothetical protein [Xanthocytophaga flavus]